MEQAKQDLLKVIVFQLNQEEYALPVSYVGAIERIHPITRVPETSRFVKGVINLRGVIIPIIDLRMRFGMEETELTDENRMIIVNYKELEVGLIVDAASDVIDFPAEEIEPNPVVVGREAAGYIEGVIKLDERLLILLDLEKVLAAENAQLNVKTEG